MHVDFAQFVEPPLPLPRQVSQRDRQVFPNDGRSVVGVVDIALLKAVAQEPKLSNEAAKDTLAAAHHEDISAWLRAMPKAVRFATIAHQMQQSDIKAYLLHLQQALELSLIEVWLGLLLGGIEQYEWETGSKFYHDVGI